MLNPVWDEHGSDAVLRPKAETVLWRYMNLAKFVSLLSSGTTGGLWFPLISTFEDPYEGAPPQALLRAGDKPGAMFDRKSRLRAYEHSRRTMCVSCWHALDNESDAMWKLYGREHAVAIRTTFERLAHRQLGAIPAHTVFFSGFVKYDLEEETNLGPDSLRWMFTKRRAFQHEHEYRFAIPRGPQDPPTGRLVPIDAATVIQEVFVSPLAPSFVKVAVESLLDRYGVDAPVTHSQLLTMPEHLVATDV